VQVDRAITRAIALATPLMLDVTWFADWLYMAINA
jgi:hypothetical protein